jgi:hypothetical protein
MPRSVNYQCGYTATFLKEGARYGSLVVLELEYVRPYIYSCYDKKKGLHITKTKYLQYYACKCDCGNECVILKASLIQGKTKSCGRCKKCAALMQSKIAF